MVSIKKNIISVVMLNVIILSVANEPVLSVVTLSVVMLNVVASFQRFDDAAVSLLIV